jgi:hypothetical protein
MKGTNQELMAHESLRARTGKIARRFLGFGLKQQILCVASFVLGYFYPLAGVVLYFVQKKCGSEPVWRFFSLAGPIFAAAIFTANFIFYSINGFA